MKPKQGKWENKVNKEKESKYTLKTNGKQSTNNSVRAREINFIAI